jgi:hypothetical protein
LLGVKGADAVSKGGYEVIGIAVALAAGNRLGTNYYADPKEVNVVISLKTGERYVLFRCGRYIDGPGIRNALTRSEGDGEVHASGIEVSHQDRIKLN